MIGTIKNVSIEGIYTLVPSTVVRNMDFAEVLGERRIKKQIRLTGIEERRVSKPGQKSSDMAITAARNLMQKINWKPEEIEVLVLVTQNPIMRIPSTAFYVQKMLGISKECVVFDVNLGCSGGVVGMQIVSQLLQTGSEHAKGLMLYSDPMYNSKPEEIVADRLLFGSAGCAVALQRNAQAEDMPFMNRSDGSRYEAIISRYNQPFFMDGEAVFEFGVNDVANSMREFRNAFGLTEDKLDFYAFHQAQKLMLDTISASCEIPEEKDMRSLQHYGNTDGASPLVSLCANRDKLAAKERVHGILCGFGIGLSWCLLHFGIDSDRIFAIEESDEVYE